METKMRPNNRAVAALIRIPTFTLAHSFAGMLMNYYINLVRVLLLIKAVNNEKCFFFVRTHYTHPLKYISRYSLLMYLLYRIFHNFSRVSVEKSSANAAMVQLKNARSNVIRYRKYDRKKTNQSLLSLLHQVMPLKEKFFRRYSFNLSSCVRSFCDRIFCLFKKKRIEQHLPRFGSCKHTYSHVESNS